MNVTFLSSINDIDQQQWNSLIDCDYPFITHQFLALLESSGSANEASGWIPFHLTLRDESNALLAIMPLYIKTHSWGEYVFDWSWAEAYQQHNLNYYPKFVSSIPFTPATGPRICIKPGLDSTTILSVIINAIKHKANDLDISGWHLLFPEQQLSDQLAEMGLPQRHATQFHWFNRNYQNFEHFLLQLTSRKRKNISKERQHILDQNISHNILLGDEITRDDWELFYHFYHMTYLKRSGRAGYLTKSFFSDLSCHMPANVILVIANKSERPIAAALYFRSSDTLFGRYWGCLEEYQFLHFESCYYQGIELCIRLGLHKFDAGAQGEHKIQRGFEPIATWSNHWLQHPGFDSAVKAFIAEEATHIRQYITSCKAHLPFKKNQ